MEFVINESIADLVEKILAKSPKIVALGVYIWNALDCAQLVAMLKKVSPDTLIVLGGPEVSWEPIRVDFSLADYIIQGEGERSFYELCSKLLCGEAPLERKIKAKLPDVKSLELPYNLYEGDDIANRIIYVETSRGCPFLCEFCISSLDERVRYFDLEVLLEEFEALWKRGVREFKFVDRTFNINITYAERILEFFLSKEPPYFLHFEVIPDHFPNALRRAIEAFPPATLQLEVGIQTLNQDIADNISRKLNLKRIEESIRFLESSNIHMHLDLIVGLPGEDLESFAKNLNLLTSWTKSEIQIGILKKLSGVAIGRHDEAYRMCYSDTPPYEILKNSSWSFEELQKMKRFARFWDMYYNSGNFQQSMGVLLGDDVFANFYRFSEWIYTKTLSTWKISLERLAELLYEYLLESSGISQQEIAEIIAEDVMRKGGRKVPKFLRGMVKIAFQEREDTLKMNRRQMRHL